MYEMHLEHERIRREEGPEAADRFAHSMIGGSIGLGSGAMAGAAVGSVVPVVGTAIGAVVGGVVGTFMGVQDETAGDNLKTAATAVRRFIGSWNK
jgi:phage tail tape-measure protein